MSQDKYVTPEQYAETPAGRARAKLATAVEYLAEVDDGLKQLKFRSDTLANERAKWNETLYLLEHIIHGDKPFDDPKLHGPHVVVPDRIVPLNAEESLQHLKRSYGTPSMPPTIVPPTTLTTPGRPANRDPEDPNTPF